MKKDVLKYYYFILLPFVSFGQVNFPTAPSVPTPATPNIIVQNNVNQNRNPQPNSVPQNYNPQYLKQMQTFEQDRQRIEQEEKIKKETNTDIVNEGFNIKYSLPSLSNLDGTKAYYDAFDKMITLDENNYSVKDINFLIENAYFNNTQSKDKFDKFVKVAGDFLRAKMKELNYDSNNNSAKNYILFKFFSETLALKNSQVNRHLPFKYDFNDFRGAKDWSKMFVSKLIDTHSGQCHSMPLLYLILAEELNAEAYLSFSPNHTYIKFKDSKNKWYNVELTNGMLTADSFVLNNGYIKAEALQNKIYMQNLSEKELLSEFYVDLANGYIHKFGYDGFVEKVINKALELYPNNISAQMIKANYNTERFQYVMNQLGIDPSDKKQLQRIKEYPKVIELLNQTNTQYNDIDNLGFTQMPEEEYKQWLNSLKDAKKKQDNEVLNKNLNISIKIKRLD